MVVMKVKGGYESGLMIDACATVMVMFLRCLWSY